MGQGRERVALKSDVFSGYRSRMGSGVGEEARPGCAMGRLVDIGQAIWRTQGDGGGSRVGREGRLFMGERRFRAHLVMLNRLLTKTYFDTPERLNLEWSSMTVGSSSVLIDCQDGQQMADRECLRSSL